MGAPGGGLLGRLSLSLVAVALCLLVAEMGVRLFRPSASLWRFPNLATVQSDFNPVQSSHIRYDRELGYEPVPGSSGRLAGKPVSYSPFGARNHNLVAPLAMDAPVILAVGDSLTEGWGVDNDETWPAHLQRDTDWRVLNAGVRGYGLDQIVLRAERMAPVVKPQAIVLAFIADDVRRSALAVRHRVHKPYFLPADGGLELRNVPVPTTPFASPWDSVRAVLGYSQLLDFIIGRLQLHDEWLGGDVQTDATVDGADVIGCRLMDRFAALVRRQQSKGLVVGLPSDMSEASDRFEAKRRRRVAGVLACAHRAGLPTLDAHAGFMAAGVNGDYQSYFHDFHLTDRGNALAARLIGSALHNPGD